MSFECSEHLHYKLLHLTGEVDLSNSSEVRTCLLDILNNGHSVVVNFSDLDYIDSSGIATLVEGLNIAKKSNLELLIVAANGAPKQVLELTRLDQVFTLIDSIDEITE
ncbi:MAG: anti-anti-sigma factor [Gammaproteobacteria bacterium]|nr:MAG: anti-anti-sigma factor [Gammaproteobacteria bacterium]